MKTEARVKAIGARKEMYEILQNQIAGLKGKSMSDLNRQCVGDKNKVRDMRKGDSYIPVSLLDAVFNYCEIEKGGDIWQKIIELERDCILGKSREKEIELLDELYCKKEENVKMSDKEKLRKQFGVLLTQYLFMSGYNLRNAAGRIGCSEHELKCVIEGKICLAPHHVERFHETIEMPNESVENLVRLARECYERPTVPDRVMEYITSDGYILDVLEKAAKKDVPAAKWKEFDEIVKEDRSRRFQELKVCH